jgi:hypothetical protein
MRKEFATIYANLDWADKHLVELRDMLKAHMRRPDVVTGTGEGRTSRFRCQGLPYEVHVLMGDVAHNLRSALNHTATLLLEANGGVPLERGAGTQFPICANEPAVLEVRAKHGAVSAEALAIIESAQPYKGTWLGRLLAALNYVSNVDKHRKAAPGRHGPGVGYSWSGTGDVAAQWEAPITTADPEVDRVALVLAEVPAVLGDGGWRGWYEVELELSEDDEWGPLHGTLSQMAQEVRHLIDRLAATVADTDDALSA